MARILVTGGPVHAKLDAVKIVTNRFRGGRIAELARHLAKRGHKITYLCAKGALHPNGFGERVEPVDVETVYHDGFIDYMEQVPELSRQHDMVILGAAVANLVPEPPWGVDQKFPSHDYQEGDRIMVPFRVAPRVINLVKESNPRCTLVGFKLLSDVSDEELVRAAYTITLDARADLVVANDATNLDRKLLVTKERSVIEIHRTDGYCGLDNKAQSLIDLVDFLDAMAGDKHYRTEESYDYQVPEGQPVALVARIMRKAVERYGRLREHYEPQMEAAGKTEGGYLFGCIATRSVNDGFYISRRGKAGLEEAVHVAKVDHFTREVHSIQGKASLNAPLIDKLFLKHPVAKAIVHMHDHDTGLPVLPYAPPGTVRDSCRDLPDGDFEIEHHGTFRVLAELP